MAAGMVRISGRWAGYAAGAIAGINVFDCLFTLAFLQLGLCQEANPLMLGLYRLSPWLFALVKLATVNACVGLLLRLKERPLARAALLFGAVVYIALAAYELAHLVPTFAR